MLCQTLSDISRCDHSNYDSFVCCILSHGFQDKIIGADSNPVKINDLATLFKGNFCRSLINKPKLFIFQACRGRIRDSGIAVETDDPEDDAEDIIRHSLPSDSDFLYGYATPPGCVSWRNHKYGSWYISSLCRVFNTLASEQYEHASSCKR